MRLALTQRPRHHMAMVIPLAEASSDVVSDGGSVVDEVVVSAEALVAAAGGLPMAGNGATLSLLSQPCKKER